MTFLNGALAFGTLAFAIPLIIHILNRSRFRTVEWGAMHLLESVIKVNHKRFRIDQIILLIVRCAIPVLLALFQRTLGGGHIGAAKLDIQGAFPGAKVVPLNEAQVLLEGFQGDLGKGDFLFRRNEIAP